MLAGAPAATIDAGGGGATLPLTAARPAADPAGCGELGSARAPATGAALPAEAPAAITGDAVAGMLWAQLHSPAP
jgi:hypothetical protein